MKLKKFNSMNKDLIEAVNANDFMLVKKLINQGAEICFFDRKGNNSVISAVKNLNPNILSLLLTEAKDSSEIDRYIDYKNPNKKTILEHAIEAINNSKALDSDNIEGLDITKEQLIICFIFDYLPHSFKNKIDLTDIKNDQIFDVLLEYNFFYKELFDYYGYRVQTYIDQKNNIIIDYLISKDFDFDKVLKGRTKLFDYTLQNGDMQLLKKFISFHIKKNKFDEINKLIQRCIREFKVKELKLILELSICIEDLYVDETNSHILKFLIDSLIDNNDMHEERYKLSEEEKYTENEDKKLIKQREQCDEKIVREIIKYSSSKYLLLCINKSYIAKLFEDKDIITIFNIISKIGLVKTGEDIAIELFEEKFLLTEELLNISDESGLNLLQIAILSGNKELINILYSSKIDKNHRSRNSMNVYDYAIKLGDKEIIELMQEYNVNYQNEVDEQEKLCDTIYKLSNEHDDSLSLDSVKKR